MQKHLLFFFPCSACIHPRRIAETPVLINTSILRLRFVSRSAMVPSQPILARCARCQWFARRAPSVKLGGILEWGLHKGRRVVSGSQNTLNRPHCEAGSKNCHCKTSPGLNRIKPLSRRCRLGPWSRPLVHAKNKCHLNIREWRQARIQDNMSQPSARVRQK